MAVAVRPISERKVPHSTAPMPVELPPRLVKAVRVFRQHRIAGLTVREARRLIGPRWRPRMAELRALGFVFDEAPSRYPPHKTYRWVLVAEPAAAGSDDDPTEF